MRNLYLYLFLALPLLGFSQENATVQEPQEIVAFKLYPNPTFQRAVYITSDEKGPKHVNIYDVFGENVLTDRILGDLLDISSLSPGVYVVRVTQNQKTSTRKLVVK